MCLAIGISTRKWITSLELLPEENSHYVSYHDNKGPIQELEIFEHRFENFSLSEFVTLWNYLVVFLYSDICLVY